MDNRTADILRRLTASFYERSAASFSDTRRGPWPGWRRCLAAIEPALREGVSRRSPAVFRAGALLDLACGNLRFESFLARELPDLRVEVAAFDSCSELAQKAALPADSPITVSFHACDALAALDDHVDQPLAAFDESADRPLGTHDAPTGQTLATREAPANQPFVVPDASTGPLLGAPDAPAGRSPGTLNASASQPLAARLAASAPPQGFDAAVAFGFLHHVPGSARRRAALTALVSATRPGGVVAASLWRFLDDASFSKRAAADHDRLLRETGLAASKLDLDPGDRLLGWRGEAGLARYCHSFSDADEADLIRSVADRARLIDRFRSDGRTVNSNAYLVFQVKEST